MINNRVHEVFCSAMKIINVTDGKAEIDKLGSKFPGLEGKNMLAKIGPRKCYNHNTGIFLFVQGC